MFHLFTHAFFKALLFLDRRLVIHHLYGEQDIRKMGGLRQSMPYTHATFLIGTLALVGIPIFAGFWSKDAILASTLAEGGALGWTLFVGGLVGDAPHRHVRVPALLPRLPREAGRRRARATTTTPTTARARAG